MIPCISTQLRRHGAQNRLPPALEACLAGNPLPHSRPPANPRPRHAGSNETYDALEGSHSHGLHEHGRTVYSPRSGQLPLAPLRGRRSHPAGAVPEIPRPSDRAAAHAEDREAVCRYWGRESDPKVVGASGGGDVQDT
ncbi:hypothetical protein V490_04153 [Pseudogymnoascus sp. VKM F-3557]|nr:hypothetical protein V490_04153 [Pseudogymnoascus sp. VKM F-3557]